MKRLLSISLFIVTTAFATADAADHMRDFYSCARNPEFIKKAGMQQPIAIDTQQSRLPGLVIRELLGQKRVYRHTSWDQTGHVASTVRDSDGNIYVVPTPSISLEHNPLENRNTIYKVDSMTGVMSPFLELPLPEQSSQTNPFGTLGLALDCESNSLYVSSVAGSTHDQINGRIYQINLSTAQIESEFAGFDPIGLGLFDTGGNKRLYFGDARSSSVFSLPVDDKGGLNSAVAPRHEFSLLMVKNGDSTNVRKIVFKRHKKHGYVLSATETEFAFRLIADSARRFKHYEFFWNPQNSGWEFLESK